MKDSLAQRYKVLRNCPIAKRKARFLTSYRPFPHYASMPTNNGFNSRRGGQFTSRFVHLLYFCSPTGANAVKVYFYNIE